MFFYSCSHIDNMKIACIHFQCLIQIRHHANLMGRGILELNFYYMEKIWVCFPFQNALFHIIYMQLREVFWNYSKKKFRIGFCFKNLLKIWDRLVRLGLSLGVAAYNSQEVILFRCLFLWSVTAKCQPSTMQYINDFK